MKKNKVLIKHNKNWGFDEDKIRAMAKKVLKEKKLKSVELSIVFVGRKKAKQLNMDYRQQSYIPQVLGFPMDKKADEDGYIRLGDIVICGSKLKYEAKFLDKKIDQISLEWLRHGLLNLLKKEVLK